MIIKSIYLRLNYLREPFLCAENLEIKYPAEEGYISSSTVALDTCKVVHALDLRYSEHCIHISCYIDENNEQESKIFQH